MQHAGIDAITLPEHFRGANDQFFFRVDNPADVIRDTSGGIGSVRTPLKDDNIQLGPATLCLGGGAHSRRIAADDDQSFIAHDVPPGELDGGYCGLHSELTDAWLQHSKL
jgi:hypothetical protein